MYYFQNLHSRRGGPIRSEFQKKKLNLRAQDPTEIAWEFYFEKLHRARLKMIGETGIGQRRNPPPAHYTHDQENYSFTFRKNY